MASVIPRRRSHLGLIVALIAVVLVTLVIWGWRSGTIDQSYAPIGIPALIIAATAAGVSFAIYCWNQKATAIDMANRWNDGDVAESRLKVKNYFPDKKQLKIAEIEGVFTKHKDAKNSLTIVLNHLDIVAMGFDRRTYERKMIRHLYLNVMVILYTRFESYIEQLCSPEDLENRDPDVTMWWYLVKVATAWRQELEE